MKEAIVERLRCRLFDSDLMRVGKELAQHTQALQQLELQKAETMSAIAAGIKAERARIAELTARINNGYEEREIDCSVLMDTPRPGLKTIVRNDTGDEIRTETMNEQDRQIGLDLQPPAPEPEPAAEQSQTRETNEPPASRMEPPDDWLSKAWLEASRTPADHRDLMEDWLAGLPAPPTADEYRTWMRDNGLEPPGEATVE